MKRAFYEWSAIGSLALALACFGYWGVSKITAAADSALSFGERALDASVSDGTVTLALRIEISLLIPAAIMSLGAAYSISRYHKIRKALELSDKAAANNEPDVHPLE